MPSGMFSWERSPSGTFPRQSLHDLRSITSTEKNLMMSSLLDSITVFSMCNLKSALLQAVSCGAWSYVCSAEGISPVIPLDPTRQGRAGSSPTLLKMEILSGELSASVLSLAHLFLGFTWCPWPWAVGIFSVQSTWNKLKVMSQPRRVRFSQRSTCDIQCIAWCKLQLSVGCLQARLPKRAVRNSMEQQRPNLSFVYPHCCPGGLSILLSSTLLSSVVYPHCWPCGWSTLPSPEWHAGLAVKGGWGKLRPVQWGWWETEAQSDRGGKAFDSDDATAASCAVKRATSVASGERMVSPNCRTTRDQDCPLQLPLSTLDVIWADHVPHLHTSNSTEGCTGEAPFGQFLCPHIQWFLGKSKRWGDG